MKKPDECFAQKPSKDPYFQTRCKPVPLPSPHFTALKTISNVLSCSGNSVSFLPQKYLHAFFHPRDTLTFFFLWKSLSKVQLQESLTTQLPETARIRQFLNRMEFKKTHVRGHKEAGVMTKRTYGLQAPRQQNVCIRVCKTKRSKITCWR